ncbi:hypothetical protein [uncultured Acidaminococcus sp.]|uniref:tetratricopeptide repeat protein n=1 Tax=uncultured Acidaminococcus sp. TaxID=352152 RepID=UPI002614F501|nr:hypothetical protein [uncultured Acidaminococcus sp.]
MSTLTENVISQFYQFVNEKTGGNLESDEQLEKLFQEFMEQYNASLDEAPSLSKETAKSVYDWLELSEQQHTKKAQRECLEKAKELEPKNLDVLMRLLLLEKKSFWEYIPEVQKILALGKEDLKERKLYKESMGDFYMVLETRPYMRVLQFYLTILASSYMIQQAIAVAKEMLKLNQNDNLGVRYTLMALYVYTEDEFNAQKLIREYKEEKDSAFFTMPLALLKFRQGKWEEAKAILEKVKAQYKGFTTFLRDAAAGRDALYDEDFHNDYYQPFTRSELITMVLDADFLWDSAQEFFRWAKAAMTPAKKRRVKSTK